MIFKETNIGECKLINGDCLEVTRHLEKVDMVIFDPPYQMTRCGWDKAIDFALMWNALSFVTAPATPILIFGMEPFSSGLRISNLADFRYDWVWEKPKATGHFNAKKQPMRAHELISVFYKRQPIYNPQKTHGHKLKTSLRSSKLQTDVYGKDAGNSYCSTSRYPRSVQRFKQDTQKSSILPTQKPVALISYFLETYSSPNDVVLDLTMGSGSTAISAMRTNRRFIGIEINTDTYLKAVRRVNIEYDK